ncbi:collagen alpha-1(I) chain isoform X1 [Plutella xylostella]|uniref:collagen alpha-1(I) chain isoform X1 n=1 Tax=Plutella xylostella TaxID=51655 RepID=UPI002033093A|nr:collagen alpha-1(I) chain isoform X1 [Plutella xylostella]
MVKIVCVVLSVCVVARTQVIPGKSRTNDGDYNTVNTDGSFDFGYSNKDIGSSYHLAHGNANKVVGGRFGARDPATNTVKETVYTAGPRGFRAKGPNIHRKIDLDQRPRGPIGNKDDPYADPSEDPSYEFKIQTRTYSKTENADSRGDVKGHYSFVDDIGERHDVSYIAGRDTGFHVSSSFPDSPNVIGSPFHRQPLVRAESKQRGRTAVQRGLDGSYRFISAGPDQRRTESSDSNGNVRGSYTFLDDKGVQRTVHYIAGPGIGYRIVKNGRDPFIPPGFPTIPSAYDPDFINAAAAPSFSPDDTNAEDVFKRPDGTAASGHVKPPPFPGNDKPSNKPGSGSSSENLGGDGQGSGSFGQTSSGGFGQSKPNSGFGQGSPGPAGFGPASPGAGYGPGGAAGGGFGPSSPSGGSAEDVHLGSPEEFEVKPTKPPGRRPGRPGRPPAGPYATTKKPYVPLKPFQSPPDSDYDIVGGSNDYGDVGGDGGYGGAGPSSTVGGSYGGAGGSTFGNVRPTTSGTVRPPAARPTGNTFSSARPTNNYGNVGPPGFGNAGPTSGSYDKEEEPEDGPSSGGSFSSSGGSGGSSGEKGPIYAVGFNIHSKPGDTIIHDDGPGELGLKPGSSFGDRPGGSSNSGPYGKPETTIIYTKPGSTIIRNVGRDYFGIPPGVSVRAHVQSIDLYPYDSKPLSPAEALEKDKT